MEDVKMKHRKVFKFILFLIFLLVLLPFNSYAQVPGQINYQGRLTDTLGNPVSDGNYDMEFALYDTDSVETALWSEQQSVWVSDGIYNVVLGQPDNELTADLFSTPLYLGVKVGDDEEMIPRQMLTSVPFAFQAGSTSAGAVTEIMLADGAVTADKVAPDAITGSKILGGAGSGVDADQLDGLDAASFSQSDHNHDTSYYSKVHVDALEARIASLEAKLQYLTVVAGTVNGMAGPHVIITGANLHVRNGLGQTNSSNQTGNLIVGYNEPRGTGNERSGSHNIVVGQRNNYVSYGGLVAGYNNAVSGIYSTVSGGSYNIADGGVSSISGGSYNTASGDASSVSGGVLNTASGYASSLSGGRYNKASGDYSFVGGGGYSDSNNGNEAFSNYSAILGGFNNIAGDNGNPADHSVGEYATVSGGGGNVASGSVSNVSGGHGNFANAWYSSVSGGGENSADHTAASVSGGKYNKASGEYSFIGGGGGPDSISGNEAFSDYSAILGGQANIAGDNSNPDNHTVGQNAAVSGGRFNKASGDYSFVGGGGSPDSWWGNEAFSNFSAILGGLANFAGDNSNPDDHTIGRYATVSGGRFNEATGYASNVSGGYDNIAIGSDSCINGGAWNEAHGDHASVSGGQANDAVGRVSSVNGGQLNIASGDGSSICGGFSNEAFSDWSAILGGSENLAGDNSDPNDHSIGEYATVSGGEDNTTSGQYSSISGGSLNEAFSNHSAILGGRGNIAGDNSNPDDHTIGVQSTVSGGYSNEASGHYSSVSGGQDNTGSGKYSSVLGGNNNPASGEHHSNVGDVGKIYADSNPLP